MSGPKPLKIFGHILAAGVFLFSASLFAVSLKAASITGIKGTVKIVDQQGKSRAAANGAAVLGDESVETGINSGAALVFDDGSKVELGPSTRVKVNDMMLTGNTTVLLYLGRLFAHILPAQAEERGFAVQTLSTVAGVRGTEFEVAAGLDGSSLVSVEAGSVAVGMDDNEVSLQGGDEVDVSYDGRINKVRRGRRNDEDWQKWFSARQQYFIDHSDQVVENLTGTVDRTRDRISDQDRKLAEMKKQLDQAYRQGDVNQKQVRNQVKKEIDSYMKMMNQLSRADNKLAAADYLISQTQEQIKQNPDAFTPEFKDKISTARKVLDQADVPELNRENRKVLATHMAGVMKAARKYGLQDEVWKRLPPKTRKQLIQKAERRKQK